MDILETIPDITLLGNSLVSIIIALLWFLGAIVLLKIFQLIVLRHLQKLAKKTKTDYDDALIEIVAGVKPPVYLIISLYIGYRLLQFDPAVDRYAGLVLFVVLVYEAMRAAGKLVEFSIKKHVGGISKKGEQKHAEGMLRILKGFIMMTLWIIAGVLILSNYGVNVSSMVTSLGIGGIAIALAVQNILSDIFSSFSIFIDKPFQVGDYITIGTDSGTVEKIGLKTTRIRTLLGEELVVSNKELTTVRIQNFKKLKKRRIAFMLGVEYGTDQSLLEEIPEIVEKIIMAQEGIEFSRCHLKELGPYSINFETVYFVEDPAYAAYVDVNQQILLALYETFNKKKIAFAFPTQTIELKK